MSDGMLLTFLESRDVPCPACAYNLRDLKSAVCPECGEGLELTVSLVSPRVGTLLAGAIGLSAGFGFCVIAAMWGAWSMTMRGAAGWKDLVPLVAGIVVEGVALWLWVARRGRVRRLSRRARVALVVGCWMLSAAFSVWFFAWVG